MRKCLDVARDGIGALQILSSPSFDQTTHGRVHAADGIDSDGEQPES